MPLVPIVLLLGCLALTSPAEAAVTRLHDEVFEGDLGRFEDEATVFVLPLGRSVVRGSQDFSDAGGAPGTGAPAA